MPAVNKEHSFWCRGQNKLTQVSSGGSSSDGSSSKANNESRPQFAMSCIPGNSGGGGDTSTTTTTTTPYERAINALHNDECWGREIALGKRVGLYRLRGDLGSGNFSKVKIAIHHLTKETVAIKTLDKTKLDAKTHRMLNREISIMQQLCHPNIVKLFEVIETFDKVHLVLECAGGGDLCARITSNGKMTEDRSKKVFAQIILAIEYLHSRNVIHRDIKAENVFLSSDENCTVKVGDFGFSTKVSNNDEHLRTFCGSPPYAAPELFQDESYAGPSVDVWALGVLLFLIVTGNMPFQANTVTSLKKLILGSEYELPNDVTTHLRSLIRGMLRRNPRERYTLEQIADSTWLSSREHGLSTKSESMYHPWPTSQPEMRSKLETETRRRMALLGITAESIESACAAANCNHPVMGTFRIFMHVLHDTFRESEVGQFQRDKAVSDKAEPLAKSDVATSNSKKIKVKKHVIIKKSRTCTIL